MSDAFASDSDSNANPSREESTPLVVDVDGTLIATDLLHEAVLLFLARHPFHLLLLIGWLLRGRSVLKSRLADRVDDPSIETIPVREEVMVLVRKAQVCGRSVYLASASDRRYIEKLADRIGGIAGVFGTERGRRNLAGHVKAEALVEAFGRGGYDYIGDSRVDFPVWDCARKAFVVAHSNRVGNSALRAFPGAVIIAQPRPALRSYMRAMRPHQWAKNVLVFLPMLAGHRLDRSTILATTLGFFCFCFAASSAYLINDLLDLSEDRIHPHKSRRPIAAGDLPISRGVALSALLMVIAGALSSLLSIRFAVVLSIYLVFTLGYSLFLKRKILLDVVTLAGLYTLRVYGGLAATGTRQTQWLLMFSLFLFLSLAIVKRCSELVARRAAGKTNILGRGYRVEDLAVTLPLAAAAGYGAVFVVTLYLSSPEVSSLYRHPDRLWLLCPIIIYWVSRVLMLTNRGELHDDPVVFALTDWTSWMTAACAVAVIAVSI